MKYAPHPRQIVRYRAPTRINHWIVAICFVLTALSGLALFRMKTAAGRSLQCRPEAAVLGHHGCLSALLLTGFVIWRQYFSHFFPIGVIRFGAGPCAVRLGTVCDRGAHLCRAWIKGSVRAMTQGKVTYGWAYKHHRQFPRHPARAPGTAGPRPCTRRINVKSGLFGGWARLRGRCALRRPAAGGCAGRLRSSAQAKRPHP